MGGDPIVEAVTGALFGLAWWATVGFSMLKDASSLAGIAGVIAVGAFCIVSAWLIHLWVTRSSFKMRAKMEAITPDTRMHRMAWIFL